MQGELLYTPRGIHNACVCITRVLHSVTTGGDEGQNVFVGNLRLPGSVSGIDLLFSTYILFSPFVVSVACAQAQCPYIDC